jgi:hypothetical protein
MGRSDSRDYLQVSRYDYEKLCFQPLTFLISLSFAFLLVAAFVPPSSGSPFAYRRTAIRWYTVPTAALGSWVVGAVYYSIFTFVIPRMKNGKELVVDRTAILRTDEDGERVMTHEIVECSWEVPEIEPDSHEMHRKV